MSDIAFDAAMTNSFWPWRFLGLIAPDFFGSPVTGDFWGYASYWEDAIYIGLLPFLLAMGVLIRSLFQRKSGLNELDKTNLWSPSRSLVIFLLILIIVSFLLALGKNTPVFPWLYKNVPTFDMFKSPTRFSIWAVFSLALLAGFGIERWKRPTGRVLYWTRLSVAGAFAVTLGAGISWWLFHDIPDFHISFVRATALAGFWGVGAGVLSLLAPEKPNIKDRNVAPWGFAVIVWVLFDLIVAGSGLNPGVELDFYTHVPPNERELKSHVGDGRLFLLSEDEYSLTYDRFFVFNSFDSDNDWCEKCKKYFPGT